MLVFISVFIHFTSAASVSQKYPQDAPFDKLGDGYYLVAGDPHGNKQDTGFRNKQVIELLLDPSQPEIPKYTSVQKAKGCEIEFKARKIQTFHDWSEMSSTQVTLTGEVKAEYKGLKAFGGKFKASKGWEKSEQMGAGTGNIITETWAECIINSAHINLFPRMDPGPTLTDDFKEAVKQLPSGFWQSTATEYYAFIKRWGSHVAWKMDMGGRHIIRFTSTESQYAEFIGTGTTTGFNAAGEILSMGSAIDVQHREKKQTADRQKQFYSSYYTASMGGDYNPDPAKWQLSLENSPAPIKVSLLPIVHFIYSEWIEASYGSAAELRQKAMNLVMAITYDCISSSSVSLPQPPFFQGDTIKPKAKHMSRGRDAVEFDPANEYMVRAVDDEGDLIIDHSSFHTKTFILKTDFAEWTLVKKTNGLRSVCTPPPPPPALPDPTYGDWTQGHIYRIVQRVHAGHQVLGATKYCLGWMRYIVDLCEADDASGRHRWIIKRYSDPTHGHYLTFNVKSGTNEERKYMTANDNDWSAFGDGNSVLQLRPSPVGNGKSQFKLFPDTPGQSNYLIESLAPRNGPMTHNGHRADDERPAAGDHIFVCGSRGDSNNYVYLKFISYVKTGFEWTKGHYQGLLDDDFYAECRWNIAEIGRRELEGLKERLVSAQEDGGLQTLPAPGIVNQASDTKPGPSISKPTQDFDQGALIPKDTEKGPEGIQGQGARESTIKGKEVPEMCLNGPYDLSKDKDYLPQREELRGEADIVKDGRDFDGDKIPPLVVPTGEKICTPEYFAEMVRSMPATRRTQETRMVPETLDVAKKAAVIQQLKEMQKSASTGESHVAQSASTGMNQAMWIFIFILLVGAIIHGGSVGKTMRENQNYSLLEEELE